MSCHLTHCARCHVTSHIVMWEIGSVLVEWVGGRARGGGLCKHMATVVAGYRKPLVSYGWAVSLLIYTTIGLEKVFSGLVGASNLKALFLALSVLG